MRLHVKVGTHPAYYAEVALMYAFLCENYIGGKKGDTPRA